jgi:hypothetical protein
MVRPNLSSLKSLAEVLRQAQPLYSAFTQHTTNKPSTSRCPCAQDLSCGRPRGPEMLYQITLHCQYKLCELQLASNQS